MEILEIYLNSKSADRYNDGNVGNAFFNLPIIEIAKNEKAYISVKNAVIPFSFYNVNINNNKLELILSDIHYSLSFEVGNYNVNTLITEISKLLGPNWTITYIAKQNKFAFAHSYSEFTFKSSATCFEILGFPIGLDESGTPLNHESTTKVLLSPIGINLFTIKNIYVTSNNFILNNIDSNNHNKSNIICSIPVNGVPNSVLFYEDNTKHLVHNIDNLTSLNIIMTDEDGNEIDFNQIHYSITLEISITK
jgi:hypothetical protein